MSSEESQPEDYHRNPRRVMVDIETLGLDPGAVIVSIGAVAFGRDGTGETFYRSIDRQSCEAAGLHTDEETLKWWQDQGEAARDELEGGEPLGDVLEEFARFYGDAEEVWANSPSFDCEHLSAAFDAVDIVELHELAHWAAPEDDNPGPDDTDHWEAWNSVLADVVADVMDVDEWQVVEYEGRERPSPSRPETTQTTLPGVQ